MRLRSSSICRGDGTYFVQEEGGRKVPNNKKIHIFKNLILNSGGARARPAGSTRPFPALGSDAPEHMSSSLEGRGQ